MVSAILTREQPVAIQPKTNIFGGRVRSVSWRVDGSPNVAEIEVPRLRIQEFRRYNAGKEISIVIKKSFVTTPIFHGWLTGRYFDYDPDSENVSFVAQGPRWRLGNDFIKGQFLLKADGNFGFMTGVRCVFNERIEGANVTPGNAALEKDASTTIRPFSLQPRVESLRQLFTVNDMIWYVYNSKSNQGRSDIIGDILTLDEFGVGELGEDTPYDVDIDGMNLRDALTEIMRASSLRWWCKPMIESGSAENPQMVSEFKAFFNGPAHKEVSEDASEEEPITNRKETKVLNLAAVGSAINTSTNNTNNGSFNEDFSEAANTVFCFGERKRFQSTVVLTPGWDLNAETDLTDSGDAATVTKETTEKTSTDWAKYQDVGRKWIVGEVDELIGASPITAFDFSTLFGSQNYAERRRFLETDLINPETNILDITVTNDDLTSTEKFKGNIQVLENQAGIYIDDEVLSPPIFVDAGNSSTLTFASQITLTAIVREDLALVKSATITPVKDGVLTGEIDENEAIERRVCHVFDDEYQVDNINTTTATEIETDLENRAKRLLEESKSPRVSASFVVPWITTGYEVGDIIDAIKGRDIFFTAQVIEVRFSFDSQQTEILAEDVRLASS